MNEDSNVGRLVTLARRRVVWNEVLAQVVLAASVGMAGTILILLLGTQLLEFRWIATLAIGSFAVALYRMRNRIPPSYRVAQMIDERLGLQDTLSTATFFTVHGVGRSFSEPMRDAQMAHAEKLARDLDAGQAIPLLIPRIAYLFGCLFLGAASLFVVRYGFERRIDLRAPLSRILMDAFGGGEQVAALQPRKGGKKPWDGPTPQAVAVNQQNPESQGKLDAAPDSVLDTVDTPDVNQVASEAGVKSKGAASGSEAGEGERAEEGSEGSDAEGQKPASGPEGEKGDKKGDQSGGKQAPNAPGENSSLASKLREAMSNMLSSLKPPSSGANQQQSQTGKDGQQGKSEQAKSGQKGQMGKGQKQGDQPSDSQEGEGGDDAESGKSAEGSSSGKSSDQQASHNPGSGMGKQDGAKDAKLAEQLAAMGKISEIIGKRSASVTGEVTVEVNSSRQQLRTPYSDSLAAHGESSGEINRDEVPLAYQHYVQQYFEEIRKTPAPVKPKKPAGL
ncbi:MAG: hypothetical protein ABIZ80_13265 [Bryobacteraceae bacterium]